MKRCRLSFFSALVVIVSGCATEPVRAPLKVQRISTPHLISESAYSQISSVVESGAWKPEQMGTIRNGLCVGASPRISIKRSFTYTPPSIKGLPVDEALRWRMTHLDCARKFLKDDFFYYTGQSYGGASQPEDLEQPLMADQLADVDREAYDRRNFVNGPQLLQKTYAARFLKPLFFREGGYVDMQLLFQRYTFRIPYDVIVKFEKTDSSPRIKLPADNHYFGYDGEKFAASMALDHQDFLWRWVAKNSTSIAEAATDNGETKFSVEMKLDIFCRYSVPVDELRSH